MTAMTIERVRAFNGLDVLVARDEGLFAAEGLDLRIAPSSRRCPVHRRRNAHAARLGPGQAHGPRRSRHVPGVRVRQ